MKSLTVQSVNAKLYNFRTIKLYKIENDDVSIVSESPLEQSMLETDVRVFIVY